MGPVQLRATAAALALSGLLSGLAWGAQAATMTVQTLGGEWYPGIWDPVDNCTPPPGDVFQGDITGTIDFASFGLADVSLSMTVPPDTPRWQVRRSAGSWYYQNDSNSTCTIAATYLQAVGRLTFTPTPVPPDADDVPYEYMPLLGVLRIVYEIDAPLVNVEFGYGAKIVELVENHYDIFAPDLVDDDFVLQFDVVLAPGERAEVAVEYFVGLRAGSSAQVPLPAPALMLGGALGALAGLGRRRAARRR